MTIKQQQLLLAYLGFDPGEIDGVDGRNTDKARKAFEGTYGVSATEGNLIAAVCGALGKVEKPPDTAKPTGTFWDEIQHFTREEFRCPCGKCGGFPVEPREEIVRICEETREHFGKPMTIVPPDGHSGGSGVRCAEYNATLGGSVSNSRHLEGKAVDFSVQGVSGSVAKAWCDRLIAQGRLRYAYIIGGNNVHMDIL